MEQQRLVICFALLVSVAIPVGSQQQPLLLPMTIPWSNGIEVREVY